MKVAILAPPWLPIPPVGYGGIENVLAILIPELMALGVRVELFTIRESTIKAHKNHWVYDAAQYQYIHESVYNSLPSLIAQTMLAFNVVKAAGDFDIIHSHNGYIDPLGAMYTDGNLPPMLHTLHGPPFDRQDREALHMPDFQPMWREFGRAQSNNFFLVGISKALMANAPPELKHLSLPPVHNGVDPAQFPMFKHKSDYFMTLGRHHPDKGQHIAVQLCRKLGYRLCLTGLVGDLRSAKQVMREIGNPLSRYRSLADFRYFSDQIFPHLEPGRAEYLGDVQGKYKLDLLGHAKALLFPIQWDEPFGMVAIEALACGTPVVAMARGALPEIIEHGVNGFLARNEQEFGEFMQRVDDIDPAACRKSVEDRFSARHMAAEYLQRYKMVLKRTRGAPR